MCKHDRGRGGRMRDYSFASFESPFFLELALVEDGLRAPKWYCPPARGPCSHQPVLLQPLHTIPHTPYLSSGGGSLSSVHPVHTCGWHSPPESACPCSCNAQRPPLCSCLQTSGHEVESQDGHRTPLWEESKHLSGSVGDRPPSLHVCSL